MAYSDLLRAAEARALLKLAHLRRRQVASCRGRLYFYVCEHAGFWQVRDKRTHGTLYAANIDMIQPERRCRAFYRALVREMFENDVCFDVAYLAAAAAANDDECILAEPAPRKEMGKANLEP